MSSQNNAFDWKGQPSETGASLGRTQTAPKSKPVPLTYSKKPAHHLRSAEAQKVGSTSRNPTANINTEALAQKDKTRKIQRGSMR